MAKTFRALVLEENEGKVSSSIRELDDSALPQGDVTVAVEYSTLNYKDGLVVNGLGRLVRNYPHVPGIDFAGTDMTMLPPHRRSRLGIGRSYQIPQPFAHMSVFENLLVGAIFGSGQRERESYAHCAAVLELTGLDDKANAPAGTLTLLQRKRLELARALAMRPRLLLLDEIGGGLTEHECQALVETIRSIHARGTTIVWIEHIVHALVSVASRLVVMNFGQLIAQGEPRQVMADPRVQEVYMGMPAE